MSSSCPSLSSTTLFLIIGSIAWRASAWIYIGWQLVGPSFSIPAACWEAFSYHLEANLNIMLVMASILTCHDVEFFKYFSNFLSFFCTRILNFFYQVDDSKELFWIFVEWCVITYCTGWRIWWAERHSNQISGFKSRQAVPNHNAGLGGCKYSVLIYTSLFFIN